VSLVASLLSFFLVGKFLGTSPSGFRRNVEESEFSTMFDR
jgi:hypothetical protein